MELVSPQPFWRLKNGLGASLPRFEADTECEVLIVGGGISGLLTAHALTRVGVDTMLIDAWDFAAASTSASTALLMYELDTPLVELARLRGEDVARAVYRESARSVDAFARLAADVGHRDFRWRESVFLASTPDDVDLLEREYLARKSIGLEIERLETATLRERYGFTNPLALKSAKAAEIDPYVFCYQLLDAALIQGLKAYDRAEMTGLNLPKDGGRITAKINGEHQIHARHLILATGYAAAAYLPDDFLTLKSTFAMATKPLADAEKFLRGSLIWESSHPYCYVRGTMDGRLVIGGLDEDFKNSELRDRLLPMKQKALAKKLQDFFPDLELEPGYGWAGTFCETPDGMPLIGTPPGLRNVHFALGYGGNGVTFSLLAAEILTDLVRGKTHPTAELFSFARLETPRTQPRFQLPAER
ncbi:MAG: FAD-binding oxidoreductase [Bdellovibrionaceae bacterium]|nr:FAD-binding oxidoreductase [Pseudobdellovibrionaceae bacterium]